MQYSTVKVWDKFVIFYHWSQVLVVFGAFIAIEFNEVDIHELLGYILTILVLSRVVWGFVGSKYARFSNFAYPLSSVISYVTSLRKHTPEYYLGHNPAGGCMVFVLIATLLGLIFTGLFTLGSIEFEGPLTDLLASIPDFVANDIRKIHELAGEFIIFILVPIHLMGVVVSTRLHKENLVGAMLTGKKKISGSTQVNNTNGNK